MPVAFVGNNVFALFRIVPGKDDYDWYLPKARFGETPLTCDVRSAIQIHAQARGDPNYNPPLNHYQGYAPTKPS